MSTKYVDLLNGPFIDDPDAWGAHAEDFAKWLDAREPDIQALKDFLTDMDPSFEKQLVHILEQWQTNPSPGKELVLIQLLDQWSASREEPEEESFADTLYAIFKPVLDILDDWVEAFKDALGIHSPSKGVVQGFIEAQEDWNNRNTNPLYDVGCTFDEVLVEANRLSTFLMEDPLIMTPEPEEEKEDDDKLVTQYPIFDPKPVSFYEREELLEEKDEDGTDS